MNAEWSRRAGRALNIVQLPGPAEKTLADAVYAVDSIEDLPAWAQRVILAAENLAVPEELTLEEIAERARLPLDQLADDIGR